MTTPDERLNAAIGAAGGTTRDAASLDMLARAAREELSKQPRARAWWTDGLVVLGFNLLLGVAAAAAMSWSETQHRSVVTKYVVGIAWFLVMALGSVLWLKPGRVGGRLAVVGGFTAAAVLTLLGASGLDGGADFLTGMRCAMTECIVAVIPVALVLFVSTRFAASTLHLVAGALAASSGAALALHFHCPNGSLLHLSVWHLLPAFVLTALAVLVRSRLRHRTFTP